MASLAENGLDMPDSPVDQYLRHIDSKSEINDEKLPNLRQNQSKAKKYATLQSLKTAINYDLKFLKKHLQSNKSKLLTHILTQDDENYLSDLFLTETTRQLACKPACKQLSAIISTSLVCMIVSFFVLGLDRISIGLLLIGATYLFLRHFLIRILLDRLIDKTVVDYMENTRQLIKFLKQIRLISLNQNYYFKSVHSLDLNFEFRKNIFGYLKGFCLDIQRLNKYLNPNLYSDSTVTLIANDNDDDEHLRILTEDFSLQSIKTMAQLNFLKISETFRLVFSRLILSDNCMCLKCLFVFWFFLHETPRLAKCLDLLKLNNPKHVENNRRKDSKQPGVTSLSLHLRNALLNCYKYEEDRTKHVDMLALIAHDLEFCALCLKKLKKSGERVHDDPKGPSVASTTDGTIEFHQDPVKISHDEVLDERDDCIFEALANESLRAHQTENHFDCAEADGSVLERDLINQSLLNELKVVLVNKQNEWIERERLAKHVKDASFDSYDQVVSSSQLLDVNLLKHKSSLRHRRKKIEPINEDDRVGAMDSSSDGNDFLSQLLSKKNEIFMSIDDDDEIIYE
jgi:hypothetical protein